MASLKLYTLLYVVVGGQLLVEEQEVDMTRTTNSQPISTVANGYSGESPGAGMVEIDVQNAIPSAGFEFDAGPYMLGLIPIPIQVRGPGGKSVKGKAFIISDATRHGVNQEAKYSFKSRMSLTLFA